ncbi:MAG TPA: sugar phosphate nucleotidyltransferase [Patescibacteria group bacterium]
MSHVSHNYAVIIAGGTGARLWPVSRKSKPKQFHPLLGETSLFQGTYKSLSNCLPTSNIIIQVNQELIPLVKEQIPGIDESNIIFEPVGRDTGPAYLFAAATVAQRDPEANVAIFWSDHIIKNQANFKSALETVFTTLNENPERIVSLGVKPDFPHTGLGYIALGQKFKEQPTGTVFEVERFVEKPAYDKAVEYLATGNYLWNTGYSAFSVAGFESVLQSADPTLATHYSEMKHLIEQNNVESLREFFESLPRISIDYWLMEKLTNMLAVPAELEWSDVSNWKTVYDLLSEAEGTDMVTRGDHISYDSHNCLVIGNKRLVVTAGVENLILIDTGDVVFALNQNSVHEMKEVVALIKESKFSDLL